MAKKKSWQEKVVDDKNLPEIKKLTGKMTKRWGTGMMVIPAPSEINAAMKTIRKGKLTTIELIRHTLVEKYDVDIACPITTGIFAWIAAQAANEAEEEGKKRITPYWRTLKTGGELNPKYPDGIENLKERLEEEGHTVFQKGKRFFVEDYERFAIRPKTV